MPRNDRRLKPLLRAALLNPRDAAAALALADAIEKSGNADLATAFRTGPGFRPIRSESGNRWYWRIGKWVEEQRGEISSLRTLLRMPTSPSEIPSSVGIKLVTMNDRWESEEEALDGLIEAARATWPAPGRRNGWHLFRREGLQNSSQYSSHAFPPLGPSPIPAGRPTISEGNVLKRVNQLLRRRNNCEVVRGFELTNSNELGEYFIYNPESEMVETAHVNLRFVALQLGAIKPEQVIIRRHFLNEVVGEPPARHDGNL
jgi:hypothetical protein